MAMTPQEAADIIEICQLRSAYAWHYDTGELEGLVGLFTDDAVCDFGPYGVWDGIEAIRGGYRENLADPDDLFPTVHVSTNPLVKVDGDTATGRWFLLDHILNLGDKDPLRLIGVYNHKFRRVDGDWKICWTKIDFLWSPDAGGRIEGQMGQPLDRTVE